VSCYQGLEMAHIWLLSPLFGVGIVWVGVKGFKGFLVGFVGGGVVLRKYTIG